MLVQSQPGKAAQRAPRNVHGETARAAVPMVSESWSATLSTAAPVRQKYTHFLGHYPGFRAAKQEANHAVAVHVAKQRPSAAAPMLSLGALAPSAALTVFDGPNESDTPFIPPDPQLAAGPTQVVAIINSLMAIYDKTGALQGSFQQLSSFFSSLGLTGEIYDPRIIYDQTDNRFILTAAEVDQTGFTNGHVLLAVSQTSDATGIWNKYALSFMGRDPSNTANTFPDFPTLGLSSSAVYISTGQFVVNSTCEQNDTCSFSDTWLKVIGLPELLAGSSALNVTTFENITTASGAPAFTIQPAVTYGSAPAEFLVAADFTASPGTLLNVFEVNTSGTPTLSTANLTVPQFALPPDAAQPGTGFQIATNDFRLLNAGWFNGSLWCGHNVENASQTGVAARWYQIAASSFSTLSLIQTGNINGSDDAYFPSLTVKPNGDVGVAFTTSSSTQFASAAFTGRAASDPLNTMRTFSLYEQGTADYVDFDLRWGDYNGTSPDPDGGSFWMIAEYAGSPDPHFGTAIAQTSNVPTFTLSTTTINFGSETIDVPSAPLSVTITNSNTTSVTLGNAAISGTNSSEFTISADNCSTAILAPAATCTISATFTPASLGARSAVLQINTNPPGLTQQVDLFGQGAQASANLNVSPSSLTFPATAAGTASAPQVVQVTNTGTSAVDLQISFGSALSAFTQTNNCAPSLGPGKTCTINVTFRPSGAGSGSEQMQIYYPGFPTGASIPTVNVSGTSINAPGVTLCPVTLTFGNQTVGTASPPQTVTVNNSGTSDLTVSAIGISGNFAQTSTCGALPATIPARSACTISVTFTPTAAGTRTGALTVTDNATGSPQSVQLTGTGVTSVVQFMLRPQGILWPGNETQEMGALQSPRGGPSDRIRQFPLHISGSSPATHRSSLVAAHYGKLPLSFEANDGQTDPQVKFLSRGSGYTMFLTSNEAVLELRSAGQEDRGQKAEIRSEEATREDSVVAVSNRRPASGQAVPVAESRRAHSAAELLGSKLVTRHPSRVTDVIRMKLVGANANARVTGADALPGKVNYLIGNDPSKWRTNVPLYAKVKYESVYPGINLVYYGNQRQLEYDFIVAPGANPNQIKLDVGAGLAPPSRVQPAAPLQIASNGDLMIRTAAGEVRFHKPVVYQPVETARGAVPASKTLQRSVSAKSHYLNGHFVLRKSKAANYEVTFQLASYDYSKPLVIDPVLSYSTYLGGSGQDGANAIALDASGSAYVAGTTASADFPLANPLQTKINRTLANQTDAFITKLSPDGTSLVYSTFLGGTNNEYGHAIAVDSQGDAYVAGETRSPDFPVTQGAFQKLLKGTSYNGGDGFLAKLNPIGSSLVYSTYFGGSGDELIAAVALDSAGDAYIAGTTTSPDLPTTPGAPQTTNGGASNVGCDLELGPPFSCGDGFVAEMNPQGAGLVYSTYLGGSGDEYVYGIAVDSTGSAYVVGGTDSRDFPTTPGAFQTGMSFNGENAFITKIKPLGARLAYSTFIGGTGSDNPGTGEEARGVAVDGQGDVYVTGSTDSLDFPTVNPFQIKTVSYGANWGFVAKLHPAGCSLIYSTYLGGIQYSEADAIAIDASGDAYVTGWTVDADFPTLNPFQASNLEKAPPIATRWTAFVTELAPSGSSLVYSSYLGGSNTDFGDNSSGDRGNAIAVDSSGNAYVAGQTDATDFPTVSAADSKYGGQGDAFVTKINPTVVPSITVNPPSVTFPDTAIGASSAPVTVTVTNTTSSSVTISSIAVAAGNPEFVVSGNSCNTTLQPNAACSFNVSFAPPSGSGTGLEWSTVTISDNAFAGPHVVPLYGTSFIPPSVSITPSGPVSFGGVPVGTVTDIANSVQLENAGTLSLNITSISASGDFSQTNNCIGSLAFGHICTVNIFFVPTAVGNRTGTLTIADNASNSPQTVTLTGAGQDFSLSQAGAPPTITAGQDATLQVNVNPLYGFSEPVTLACSGAPPRSSCVITSPETPNGTLAAVATVTVVTGARSAIPGRKRFYGPLGFNATGRALSLGLLALLAATAIIASSRVNSSAPARNWRAWIGISTVFILLLLWASCGGGGGSSGGGPPPQPSGTPAGNYTLTITGASGKLTHTTTLTLTVQ